MQTIYNRWPLILANNNTEQLHSYLNFLSCDNFCSIEFKPFWLPQLPVNLQQALGSKKNKKNKKTKNG